MIWDLYGSSTASPDVEEFSGGAGGDIPWLAVSLSVIGCLLLLLVLAVICLCSPVRAWLWGFCSMPVALDVGFALQHLHPDNVLAMVYSPPIPAGSVSDAGSDLVEVVVANPVSLPLPVLPVTVFPQAGQSGLWSAPVVETVAIDPDCTPSPIPPVR